MHKIKLIYIDITFGIILSILLLVSSNPIHQNITFIKDNVSFLLAFSWFIYSSISIIAKLYLILKSFPNRSLSVASCIALISYGLSYIIPYKEGGGLLSNLHVDLSLFTTIALALICIYLLCLYQSDQYKLVSFTLIAFTLCIFIIILFGGINTISELLYFFSCNILLYSLSRKSIDNSIKG